MDAADDDRLQDLLFQTANIQEGPLRVDLEELPGAKMPTVFEAGAFRIRRVSRTHLLHVRLHE